eukprot:jgi/Psemu1/5184/gm1.5184_g
MDNSHPEANCQTTIQTLLEAVFNNNKFENNTSNINQKKTGNKKLVGCNQSGLEGIVILEDATPKHYSELNERIETYGRDNYNPCVAASSESLTKLTRKDLTASKPNSEEYEPTDMYYNQDIKARAVKWVQYQEYTEKIYRATLVGLINDGTKAKKIKSDSEWKKLSEAKCVIEQTAQCVFGNKICYQSSCTKAHAPTKLAYAMRKLYFTQQQQQRNLDAPAYAKSIKENIEVAKSSSSMSQSTPRHAFTHTYEQYVVVLGDEVKGPIDREDCFVATLIVKGNKHPSTTGAAVDVLIHFKKTKKATGKSCGQGTSNTSTVVSTWSQKGQQQDLATFVNKGSPQTSVNSSTNARKPLMNAVEQGGDFGGDRNFKHQFVQFGVESAITILFTHVLEGIMAATIWIHFQDDDGFTVTFIASLEAPPLMARTAHDADTSSVDDSSAASNQTDLDDDDSSTDSFQWKPPPLVHSWTPHCDSEPDSKPVPSIVRPTNLPCNDIQTSQIPLVLICDNTGEIYWYEEAALAVYDDMCCQQRSLASWIVALPS